MGTCFASNKPPEKFVGKWTDHKNIDLTINADGSIDYQKQSADGQTKFAGPTRFRDNELYFSCCCCFLRGSYNEEDSLEPKIIVNGHALTKVEQQL